MLTLHSVSVKATRETYGSIQRWRPNNRTNWFHPVGSVQYASYRIGDRVPFICIGDPSKNTTVEIVAKGGPTVYEAMKTMCGPFDREADFPWTTTYLVLVKVV